MTKRDFAWFLGIDQTGAAARGGAAAKPLPCALLQRAGRGWRLVSRTGPGTRGLQLTELNPRGLARLFAEVGAAAVPLDMALMIDCVFGLPESVARGLGLRRRGASHMWKLFQRAGTSPAPTVDTAAGAASATDAPRFGRAVSEAFFAGLVHDSAAVFSPLPRRSCELAAGANSVFLTRPFQRNVQTGTHRIWRDLAAAGPKPWAELWPFDTREAGPVARPWLFESYPSLFWRELFGLRTRDRTRLAEAVQAYFRGKATVDVDDWSFIAADGERADAAVLALGGLALQLEDRLFTPFPGFNATDRARPMEGWIAGLQRSP